MALLSRCSLKDMKFSHMLCCGVLCAELASQSGNIVSCCVCHPAGPPSECLRCRCGCSVVTSGNDPTFTVCIRLQCAGLVMLAVSTSCTLSHTSSSSRGFCVLTPVTGCVSCLPLCRKPPSDAGTTPLKDTQQPSSYSPCSTRVLAAALQPPASLALGRHRVLAYV